LLPFRVARKKENLRRGISIFLLSFGFTGIALFYCHLMLRSQIYGLSTQVDSVTNQLKAKRRAAQEVDEIKKTLDVLKIKTEGIHIINSRRREPVQLLDTMTRVVIPKRMWFTTYMADNNAVTIRGIALDQKTVADFMTRLESTGLFSSVNLATLKHVDMSGLGLKSFEVSCDKVHLEKNKEEDKRK
jgi:type IV pilus assembly protein PilN